MKLFVSLLNLHLLIKENSFDKTLIHRLWKYSIFFFDPQIIFMLNRFSRIHFFSLNYFVMYHGNSVY